MKTKAIAVVITTMLLVPLVISVLPVKAVNYLKIGVIRPVGWPQGLGMEEGAELAKNWINGPGGGIVIEGTRYDVQLFFAWDHAEDMRPDLGALEMERLVGDGAGQEDVDLVIGGFRTECVMAMREVAMDYNKLFFVCGASANELVDCGDGSCDACVRCDYDRYKYLFRVTPVNVTMLILNIAGFMQGNVYPKLVNLYGSPVKTAVLAEDLNWTVGLYNAFTLATSTYLSPDADVVYSARTAYPTKDFSSYLNAMHADEVRLVVHIYSTGDTMTLVRQMAVHPIKAVLVGIDAMGQCSEFEDWTDGQIEGCDYETFLAASGTRTPVSDVSQPYNTTDFWDLYYAAYDHAPISTSFGAYDAIIATHDLLEANTIHPPFDTADADALIPIIEATDRESLLGRFKYTQYHDPFSNEYGYMWIRGYVRPLVVQWQAGRLEVVWPLDRAYSKRWVLPDEEGSMYPYPSDVDQDGDVDFGDALIACWAYKSYPAAPDEPARRNWHFAADVRRDNFVDAWDLVELCWDYGESVTLPLAYCDESGHLGQ